MESRVPIVQPRAVEKAAVGIAGNADLFGGKGRGREILVSRGATRVEELDTLPVIVGKVHAIVETAEAPTQRKVSALHDPEREAGGEPRNSGDLPASEKLARHA